MTRPAVFLSSLLFGAACAAPPQEEPDAGVDAGLPAVSLRLGTFNTRLFFDTTCQSGMCGPADFEQAPTQAEFDARADAISGVLRDLSVDVAVLQEVETQASLDALASRLSGVFDSSVLGEIGTAGSVDVAVLARGDVERVVTHRDTTPLFRPDGSRTVFSREFLEVHLRIDGVPVIVFAAHFRSKVQDDPGRRLAEAQAARDLVTRAAAAAPGVLVVLAGDLNDTPGSPPLDALEGNGGLLRVAKDLPPAEQATYVFNGSGEAIDHLLEATSPPRYVAASALVERIPRSESTSDHWPLRATFLVPR
ncbi:MAG: endonuclease/exonuclease/phosphatase family protein [Myxococcota bacterium]